MLGFLLVMAALYALAYFAEPENRQKLRAWWRAQEERRALEAARVAEQLRELEPLFNVAHTGYEAGDFSSASREQIARQRRDHYLNNAGAIEAAFRSTDSPIWNEARCRTIARFLKVNAPHNPRVVALSEPEIAKLLYDYRSQDWEILKCARRLPPPEAPAAGVQYATPVGDWIDLQLKRLHDVIKGEVQAATVEAEEHAAIDADPTLSPEEKARRKQRVSSEIQKILLALRRKAGQP